MAVLSRHSRHTLRLARLSRCVHATSCYCYFFRYASVARGMCVYAKFLSSVFENGSPMEYHGFSTHFEMMDAAYAGYCIPAIAINSPSMRKTIRGGAIEPVW